MLTYVNIIDTYEIPKNEMDIIFLCLVKMILEGGTEEDEHLVGAYTTVMLSSRFP